MLLYQSSSRTCPQVAMWHLFLVLSSYHHLLVIFWLTLRMPLNKLLLFRWQGEGPEVVIEEFVFRSDAFHVELGRKREEIYLLCGVREWLKLVTAWNKILITLNCSLLVHDHLRSPLWYESPPLLRSLSEKQVQGGDFSRIFPEVWRILYTLHLAKFWIDGVKK